jgi:prophage regulatory protein
MNPGKSADRFPTEKQRNNPASGSTPDTRKLSSLHVWQEPERLEPIIILRLPAVLERIQRSRATLYAMGDKNHPSYDPLWPSAIRLGARSVGWIASEVDAWIASRVAFSRISSNSHLKDTHGVSGVR